MKNMVLMMVKLWLGKPTELKSSSYSTCQGWIHFQCWLFFVIFFPKLWYRVASFSTVLEDEIVDLNSVFIWCCNYMVFLTISKMKQNTVKKSRRESFKKLLKLMVFQGWALKRNISRTKGLKVCLKNELWVQNV